MEKMSDKLRWIVALRAGHVYNEKSSIKRPTALDYPVFETSMVAVEEARERGL